MTDELRPRAFRYVGESRYVDGVPFGHTLETGDCYVSAWALWPGDIDLLAEIERLRPDSDPHTETLWEGPTHGHGAADPNVSSIADQYDSVPVLKVPPGTRVRVVRDKDQP